MTDTFKQHCETVYKALKERATVRPTSDGTNELVFTGAVSEVYQSLNISQTYYGPIFETLEDIGAILRIQRGGRGIDSVMVIRELPEVWPKGLGWKGRNSRPLTDDSRYATLLLDVQRLQESIGGLNVLNAMMDFENRLQRLEAELVKMKGQPHNG